MKLEHVDVSAVLRHLGELADVESLLAGEDVEGCIAGQAVASAVQDLYFGGRGGVYNDIDVFSRVRKSEPLSEPPQRAVRTVLQTEGILVSESYAALNYSARVRYQVLSTSQEGLFNHIGVDSNRIRRVPRVSMEVHELFARDIVRSFDFNCVQVGIDLKNRKLIWTPEFERFVQSRQIEVSRHHTPGHTAIRLLKKLSELPEVYADVDRVMHELAGAQLAQLARELQGRPNMVSLAHPLASALVAEGAVRGAQLTLLSCQRHFGTKYRELAETFADQLRPWFKLEAVGASTYVHTLSPLVSPDEQFMQLVLSRPQEQYSDLADAFLKPHKPAVKERYKLLLGVSGNKSSPKLLPVWPSSDEVPFKSLLQDCAPLSVMARVSKKVVEHPELISLMKLRSSVSEQVQIIELVMAEAKVRGGWVYGFSPALGRRLQPAVSAAGALDEGAFRSSLRQELDAEEAAMNKTLKSALFEPRQIGGVFVRELTTRKALVVEGSQLRHCVGGYAHAVEAGQALIYSLRADPADPRTWSTLQVTCPMYWLGAPIRGGFRVVQHRGRFNSEPPSLNQAALGQLIKLVEHKGAAQRYPLLAKLDRTGALALKYDGLRWRVRTRWLPVASLLRRLRPGKSRRPVYSELDSIPF